MFAGGLAEENRTHAVDACLAAVEIQEFMATSNRRRERAHLLSWEVGIGIHTGGVMADDIGPVGAPRVPAGGHARGSN